MTEKIINKDNKFSGNSKIFKSVISISISKIIAQLIYFLGRYVILLNWLDTSSNADFILFFRNVEIFFSFFIIGTMVLPRFVNEENKKIFEKNISPSLSIMIINSLLLVISMIIWGIMYFSSSTDQNYKIIYILLLILTVVSMGFMKLFESILYGLKKNSAIAILNLVLSGSFLLMIWIFVKVLKLDFEGALLSYFFCNFIAFLIGFYYFVKIKRNLNAKIKFFNFKYEKSYYITLLKFSVPIMLNMIAYLITYRINTFFLQDFPEEFIVYYDTSTSLILYLIGLIGIPIHDAIYPYLSNAFIKKREQDIKEIYMTTTFAIIAVLLTSLIFTFVFIPIIIAIFLPEYNNVIFYHSYRILIFGGFFYIMNQMYGRYPVANGKSRILLITQLIGAFINILMILLFVYTQIYDILLWGFFTSSFIIFLIIFKEFKKETQISFKDSLIIKMMISYYIPIIFYYIIIQFYQNTLFIGLIIFGSYILFIFGLKLVRKESFISLTKIFKKK